MSKDTFKLEDFVGRRFMLSGVNMELHKATWGDGYEDSSVINFCLDGVIYSAIEDPQDGYRSSLSEIRKVLDVTFPMQLFPSTNLVDAIWQEPRDGNDVVEFIDVSSGKTVLEVGTRHTDDYYPCFVSAFHPQNMAINNPGTTALKEGLVIVEASSLPSDWASW
jgi:hypothetical protein